EGPVQEAAPRASAHRALPRRAAPRCGLPAAAPRASSRLAKGVRVAARARAVRRAAAPRMRTRHVQGGPTRWRPPSLCEACGVNDETISYVAAQHPLVGLVDALRADDLDVGGDAVPAAEVQ